MIGHARDIIDLWYQHWFSRYSYHTQPWYYIINSTWQNHDVIRLWYHRFIDLWFHIHFKTYDIIMIFSIIIFWYHIMIWYYIMQGSRSWCATQRKLARRQAASRRRQRDFQCQAISPSISELPLALATRRNRIWARDQTGPPPPPPTSLASWRGAPKVTSGILTTWHIPSYDHIYSVYDPISHALSYGVIYQVIYWEV
jgi:hypothetical protein